MKTLKLLSIFGAISLAFSATQTSAGVIYQTPTGANALMGYISTDNNTLAGTQYVNPGYVASSVIDGNLGTRADTYSGAERPGFPDSNAPLDFVGVLWSTPQNNISSIRLYQFLYFDGGWFGTETGDTFSTNSSSPPTNSTAANEADANDVAAPTVQITTDGGSSWTSIIASENYVNTIRPSVLSNFIGTAAPVSFNFATQNGINGIRLVGYGGGRSDVNGGRDEQGFIGVSEFEIGVGSAMVPEPASMALFGLGSLGIGVIARRRKKQQLAA